MILTIDQSLVVQETFHLESQTLVEFDVPESGMWVLGVEREFPITYSEEDSVNVFPIHLDGVPFSKAYLVVHSL